MINAAINEQSGSFIGKFDDIGHEDWLAINEILSFGFSLIRLVIHCYAHWDRSVWLGILLILINQIAQDFIALKKLTEEGIHDLVLIRE